MMPGFVVGLLVGLVVVCFAAVWYVLVIRRRHGGGIPMPAWAMRAEHASPALRALVSKMARSAAADAMQEWSTLPAGLKHTIRTHINMAIAEALASQEGRRK